MDVQKIHVTLKHDGRRLDRKSLMSVEQGRLKYCFQYSDLKKADLSVAAFVGADYSKNLQHVVTSIR